MIVGKEEFDQHYDEAFAESPWSPVIKAWHTTNGIYRAYKCRHGIYVIHIGKEYNSYFVFTEEEFLRFYEETRDP
jgi:hypothetical protein